MADLLGVLEMTTAADPVKLMKQEVGKAAAAEVRSGLDCWIGNRVNNSICHSIYRRSPQVW